MIMLIKNILILLIFISCFSVKAASENKVIWVDVRSYLEHSLDNIKGDERVSHGEIVERLSQIQADKKSDIRLYCKSGGRAAKAKNLLNEAGYTNVTNVGSIEHAREIRGLIE